MLSFILASALLAGAPPSAEHVERIATADVAYFHIGDFIPNGQPELFIMRFDGSTLLVEFDELRLVSDSQLEVVLLLDENPTIFRTSYTDANGLTHEIITNCSRFPKTTAGAQRCAAEHLRGIEAMLALFPKTPNRETDVDFEIKDADRDIKW